MWRKNAVKQLEDIDSDAKEDGLEPPSNEARDFAKKFIDAFSKMDLPDASVFADENRGVSIQMEVTGFAFLLTCFEGGRGIYNIAHRLGDSTTSLEASYNVSSAKIVESAAFRHLRCLIKPLVGHAEPADQL